MKSITYGYGNNGLFPYRYIKKRSSTLSETFVNPYKADKTIQSAETGNINSLKNLCKGYLTKGVSENTQRKIAKHCRVLGLSAEKRKVRNSKGNYIDHLCSFITLTLPCEQKIRAFTKLRMESRKAEKRKYTLPYFNRYIRKLFNV